MALVRVASVAPLSKPRMNIHLLAVVLALLNAVGPISTDMYLPAFASMRASLGGSASAAPLTLAAWFLGLAVGQLLLGPLSDQAGRRKPLIIGMAIYMAGSAGCACSQSLGQLIAFRCLAAAGGAAGLVIPRAIVRDLATHATEAAGIVARIELIMSVMPILCPTFGGLIVSVSGWRMLFMVQVGFGLACIATVSCLLVESLRPDHNDQTSILGWLRSYLAVARHPVFRSYTLIGSFATFSLFCFLGQAPTTFLHHFGWSPTQFGLTFVPNGAAFALGTHLNVVSVKRFGQRSVFAWTVSALVFASGLMVALTVTTIGGAWSIALCFVMIMLLLGFVLPGAAIGAIGPFGSDAGVASALYGTAVFAIGAMGTVLVAFVGGPGPLSMALLMLAGTLLALVTLAMTAAKKIRS